MTSRIKLMKTFSLITILALAICASFVNAQQAERPLPYFNAKMIYVSPTGSDANSGLSSEEAVQTVAHGLSLLRDGQADWLLLERGHDYELTQQVDQPSGAAIQIPMVISAYGEGATPELNIGPNSDRFSQDSQDTHHITVYDVTMVGLDNPFPILQPGTGWTGETPQPDPVGTPGMAGYDAKAIARWDVVPYQTFDDKFHIGVVAFHMNGIDRVSFSVDNGPWIDVQEMQHNPRTDVWEYTVTLDAELFAEDGPIEVRAIAWPEGAGEARVFAGNLQRNGEHSMLLNANARGTWGAGTVYVSNDGNDSTADGTRNNPFKTIWRAMQYQGVADISGLHVKLESGSYSGWGGGNNPRPLAESGWVTIEPAENVGRDEVILLGGGRFRTKLVRFHNVSFDSGSGGIIGRYDYLDPGVWLDQVVGQADGRVAELVSGTHFALAYLTDVSLQGYRDGAEGMILSRNVRLHELGSDAFGDSGMVVNCSVDDIATPPGSGFHPDVFQFSGRGAIRDNTIVYGLRATNIRAQGIFADDLAEINNSAFVNILIDSPTHKSQWAVSANHLLLWHVSLINQKFVWRTSQLRNLSVIGNLFERVEGRSNLPSDATIHSNHVVYQTNGFGLDQTTGPSMLSDPSRGDYQPISGSPLLQRFSGTLAPVYSNGEPRTQYLLQTIGSEMPATSTNTVD